MQNSSAPQRVATRVLLADTGELLCQQVSTLLSGAGCELLTAADGFEVLCRLPELRPDVILLAADLPRLSGIQVCSLLRQSPDFRSLPVLMLVGENAIVDKVRAGIAGADACLEKPFRSADLQAAFRQLLHQHDTPDKPDMAPHCREPADHGLSVHSG